MGKSSHWFLRSIIFHPFDVAKDTDQANKQLCETTQPGETCAHCSARVTNNSRSRVPGLAIGRTFLCLHYVCI